MLSKSRFYTLFLYVLVAIAIAFAPIVIRKLHRDVDPLEPMRNEQADWVGIIEMWNTCYVKASKGSQVAWIEKYAIESFEYDNQGVYVRTVSVDPTKVEHDLSLAQASNDLPDIVSIPPNGKGVFDDIHFEDNQAVLSNTKVKSFVNVDDFGIPWAIGSYVYLLNKDLCVEKNLPVINHTAILTDANQYAQSDDVNAFLFPITCHDQILETITQHQLTNIDFISESDYYRIFLKNNQSIAAIAPLRIFFMAETLQADGKINQFEAQKAPDWIVNNQICRLGLIKQDNALKKDLCIEFLNHLLSETVQQEIDRLGMFSVKDDIEVYDTGLLAEIEKGQKENNQ